MSSKNIPVKTAVKPTPAKSEKTEDPKVQDPEIITTQVPEKGETFPMLKRAKEVFASHSVDILYFTEDNTAFLEPQFARIHAESLKSQKVTPIERKEIV